MCYSVWPKIVNISDLQVPSHINKLVNITYKSQAFFVCVSLPLHCKSKFHRINFYSVGQKAFSGDNHSFIHAVLFLMQAESSLVDAAPASLNRVTMNADTHGWPCHRCPCVGHHGTSWLADNSQWQWQRPARPSLLNPLSPNIHMQILQTGLYTFPSRISWENLVKDQKFFSLWSFC